MRQFLLFGVGFLVVIGLGAGAFFMLPEKGEIVSPVLNLTKSEPKEEKEALSEIKTEETTSTPHRLGDLDPQPKLGRVPEEVKGIYMTGWIAGVPGLRTKLLDKFKATEVNTVVVDIKDYSGYLSYETDIELAKQIGAHNEPRIAEPNKLIKELHDRGLYVVGRISVFQDPILAKGRPDLALKVSSTGKVWVDKLGLAWVDSSSKEVWDYHIAIAKDALQRGFDEVNFDYIRFPSDGRLGEITYPFWDGVTPRHKIIGDFYSYLRSELKGERISGDIFGQTTVSKDDMGIGQLIENAYRSFDYVMPMVYPSHYVKGFAGYPNPALYPYEVLAYSYEVAVDRYEALPKEGGPYGKLRPWLQAFNMGATYDKKMIDLQIKAGEDVIKNSSSSNLYGGWVLWDPSNKYIGYFE